MRGLNPLYSIGYLESVIHSDIPSLTSGEQMLVKKAVEEKLRIDPMGYGRPLRYSFQGHRRLRVGDDIRILYRIEPIEGKVFILAIRNIRPKDEYFRTVLARELKISEAA
jgi:mRNA interferase RelE/StbE